MSNFAQIITSFERTGNFPIEANYIFPTVEDLKQFYSDPIQAVTLHKGLLKVVEKDPNGRQALYWVTKKETNDELEFTNLVAGHNIEELKGELTKLAEKLDSEINDRKTADTAIWGVNDPSNIDEGYNSINDLGTQIKAVKEALESLSGESVSGDNSLKNQLKAAVGTTDNDIIAYLDTLPYKSITELANAVNKIVNAPEEEDATDAIDTLKELATFLDGYTNKDTLKKILEKLWFTIEGDVLPSESFRTLRGIEDYLIEYRTANDYKQRTLLEELNNIETAIGLNADGSYTPDSATNYLQGATSVMNALQILDKLLHRYISANVPSVRNDDEAVKLSLTQELDSYVLAAVLKLSTQAGNQLIKNTDGLYACAKTYYDKGILTFKVNDNIVSQHYIGMSAIVQSATYDKDNEQLVFVFKLDSGDTQTVQIPVGALIREWEVENKDNSPIVLEREDSISGTDRLSADIRLSTLPFNILVKDHNTLYVKGSSDNIYHDGLILRDYLDSLQQSTDDNLATVLQKLEEARLDREAIKKSVETEAAERQHQDAELSKDLTKLGASLIDTNNAVIDETAARKDADAAIREQLHIETQRASAEEARLQMEIRNESDRAKQTEGQQAELVQILNEKLNSEIVRSTAADSELGQRLDNLKHPEYTIIKQSTPEAGCIATYVLMKDGVQTGNKVDIPEVPVKVNATFVDGVLTLIVNDQTVGIFDLGLAAIVKDSYYDTTSDELVVEYNLHNGKTQVVRTSLKIVLDKLENTIKEALDEYKAEIDGKAPLDSPVFKGIPQIEIAPEENDSSQRLASTAWVQKQVEKMKQYAEDVAGLQWVEIDETFPDGDNNDSWIDV